MVADVDLPTGYYFGFSAATGDLAGWLTFDLSISPKFLFYSLHVRTDSHDILTVRVYDVDRDEDNNKADEVCLGHYVMGNASSFWPKKKNANNMVYQFKKKIVPPLPSEHLRLERW